jgi:small subunit ribosomal protein S11
MGKKRIVKKGGEDSGKRGSSARTPRRKLDSGILYVEATYNNTKVSLTDPMGNVVIWSSSGSLGFSGAKKGTPFAAAKVGELLCDKAETMGVKEVAVVVSGVGASRLSAHLPARASTSPRSKTQPQCRTTGLAHVRHAAYKPTQFL